MTDFVDATFTLNRLKDGRTTLVNLLDKGQFDAKHIPGSINVPVEEPGFDQRIRSAVPDQDRPVIVHCSSNDCQASSKAARKMEALGYKEVYDFKSGLEGWEQAGQRFETGGVQRPDRPVLGQVRKARERSEERKGPLPANIRP